MARNEKRAREETEAGVSTACRERRTQQAFSKPRLSAGHKIQSRLFVHTSCY